MEQQKWYQVDLYLGLLDTDNFLQYPIDEAVDKITKLIGDCTIIPCIGSCTHSSGIRINLNTLKIIKFIDKNPDEFTITYTSKFKEIFNQDNILVNITECSNLKLL